MSVMHIVLCRKPVEGTVSSNVVEHGTGGLNIDGCRIATGGESLAGGVKAGGGSATDGWDRPFMHDKEAMKIWGENKKANQAKATQLGRFPANVILSHHPECVCMGEKKVTSNARKNKQHGNANGVTYGNNWHGESTNGHGEVGEKETVESWECHDDCPIRKLDEQSGERKGMSGGGQKGNKKNEDWIVQPFNRVTVKKEWVRGDTGGASRFFKNIQEE